MLAPTLCAGRIVVLFLVLVMFAIIVSQARCVGSSAESRPVSWLHSGCVYVFVAGFQWSLFSTSRWSAFTMHFVAYIFAT